MFLYNSSKRKICAIFLAGFTLSSFIIFDNSSIEAVTNFYVAIPDVVQNLKGITFTVETSDNGNYTYASWTNNGSYFIPDNQTLTVEPTNNRLHLDNNNFLLAISNNIDIGTRLLICATLPFPFDQRDCQWDAVDKQSTGYAEFDFFFQSH